MKRLSAIVAALAICCLGVVGVLRAAGPSDADLGADIEATKAEIADAEVNASRYSGGAILLEIQLREAVLKNTLAMLEQKRTALLRGITITYPDPTPRVPCYVEDSNVQAELRRAIAEADAAHQEAAQYSGGLVQIMALVREATARTTAATVEQRIAFVKLGIALPDAGGDKPEPLSGKPTPDKDAL